MGDDLDRITDFEFGLGGDTLIFSNNPNVMDADDLTITEDGSGSTRALRQQLHGHSGEHDVRRCRCFKLPIRSGRIAQRLRLHLMRAHRPSRIGTDRVETIRPYSLSVEGDSRFRLWPILILKPKRAVALARATFSPGRIGEQAIVTDAMKAAWQDVGQEAADEFVGAKRHGLVALAALDPVVLVFEDDALIVHRD